jgi:hypothetical protein
MVSLFIDVESVLSALGIPYEEVSAEYRGFCPMHEVRTGKPDNNPSWFINQDTGQHICFSCGYKGNLAQLVCDVNEFYTVTYGKVTGYDYAAAETWISQVSEVPLEKLMEMFKALPNYVQANAKPLEMSEARLAVFVDPPEDALKSRNISLDSAKKYGVLWDAQRSNWILPLREPHFNRLMGWQEKGTLNRTFFNRPTGLKRSKTLFGIENQNELCTIVVESPLDCVRIHSAGVDGAVAVCGSSLSEEQVRLFRYSEKIIAAFDNDTAGHKANKELLQFARKYGLNLFFFNYGSTRKKDPGDMTDEEILWGIKNAKTALLGESAYVQRDTETLPS